MCNKRQDISREGIYPEDDTTRMLLRKSQMNWGWDFCGHCLTTGIWKPVLLKSRDHAVLHETQLITEGLEGDSAELRLWCSVMDYIEEKPDQTILLELQAAVSYTHLFSTSGSCCLLLLRRTALIWASRTGML